MSFDLGKWEEAREWYRKAQTLDQKRADIWYVLGVVAWRWSKDNAAMTADAIADFERAVALDSEHEDAMMFLSLLNRQRHDDIAAGGWLDLAADVRSERMQAEIARTATQRRLPSDGPDSLLQQWTSMALSFPAPPPPPPPPTLGTVHEAVPAVVSWELRIAAEEQTPARIRVSRAAQEQKLMTKVNPISAAADEHPLRFVVVIGKDGRIVRQTLVSGNVWLAPAAVEALHQWVYQPTLVNGKPVEVVTEVLVPFQRAY